MIRRRNALPSGRLRFMSVMFHMRLCRFSSVVGCVVQMSLSRMCVVSRQLMIPRLMMLCGFAVVLAGMLQMVGCFVMMLCCLPRHSQFPLDIA